MSFTSPTPGLVPHFDVIVHIVLDDFGKAGRVYREIDEEDTTLGSVVDDLLTGQFNNPVPVRASSSKLTSTRTNYCAASGRARRATRCASSPSTRPKDGRGMSPRMSLARW